MRGECFNVDNCPDMKVSVAIEISCDLPYIFTKKKYNGNVYVDGGFINNYPINLADDYTSRVLGICVFGEVSVAANDYIRSGLSIIIYANHGITLRKYTTS